MLLPDHYLFKSPNSSCRYICKDGFVCHFVGGEYYTNVASRVEELQNEAALGNPFIVVDPLEPIKEMSVADPMAALEERIREQLIREGYTKNIEPSTSEQGKLNPSSTADIAAVTLGTNLTSGATNSAANVPTPVAPATK